MRVHEANVPIILTKFDNDCQFEDEDSKKLLNDIANNGILNPIVVCVTKSQVLQVIDGRKRCACVSLLLEFDLKREKNDSKWFDIPAIVYEDTTPEEVEKILREQGK